MAGPARNSHRRVFQTPNGSASCRAPTRSSARSLTARPSAPHRTKGGSSMSTGSWWGRSTAGSTASRTLTPRSLKTRWSSSSTNWCAAPTVARRTSAPDGERALRRGDGPVARRSWASGELTGRSGRHDRAHDAPIGRPTSHPGRAQRPPTTWRLPDATAGDRCAGFIGAEFVRFVLSHARGVRLTDLGALTDAGTLASLAHVTDEPQSRFVEGVVRCTDLVAALVQDADAVTHVAAASTSRTTPPHSGGC